MKVQIVTKSKDLFITQGLKNVIYKKIEKLNEKYIHDRDTIHISVILKAEHNKHICEVIVFAPKHTFKKEVETDDMYKSINKVFDIMDNELRRHKEKLLEKRYTVEEQESVCNCENCNCK